MSRAPSKTAAPRRTASKTTTTRTTTRKTTTAKATGTKTKAAASRSTSAKSRTSTASRSGSTRARSAALAKSAPTVRMRIDERDLRPEPRPSSADILAVALVVFMSILAACSSQFDKGRGDPTGQVTPAPQGEVSVQFLDIGQGDSILVRSPEGKTMLVDGGRSTERMREQLAAQGVDKVDLMVATHADADHIAGLVEAAKTARPTLFINNGVAGTTQTWDRLVTALEGAGTTFQKANNQVVNLGSVKVRVIAPPTGMGDDQNDNSVGVRVEFGEFVALMTGDSEKKETDAWIAENRAEIRGPVQVYKSIHHGAANGDHQAWFDVVQPENVVISVGENNYGHPTQAALDLYKANKLRVYRTDRQGTITFKGKADGTYIATTER